VKTLDVCAAVICRRHRFLLARRLPGSHLAGCWEFPGGKQQPAETLQACMQRELFEELHVQAEPKKLLSTLEHEYPEKRIRLHFFACELPRLARVIPAEGQEIGWFTVEELLQLELAPADRIFAETSFSGT